jgi:integrase
MSALTVESVKAMKPGAARREIPDAVVPGLYLVIQPSGLKSWALRYRIAGKSHKLTLGGFPQITLAEKDDDKKARLARDPKSSAPDARGLARSALAALAAGKNPAVQKKIAASGGNGGLVSAVWEEFKERHIDKNMKSSSAERFKRMFENHILPEWKDRRFDEIVKRDVLNVIDDAAKRGPHAANSAVTVLSIFFNWALGRDMIVISPMLGVKKPTAESSRERTLADKEIKSIWDGCAKLNPVFSALVKLLLLTGARRNEVADMTWVELDIANRLWTIPASRTKNDVEHRVYLSDAALAEIKKLPHVKDAKFVLTTDNRSAVSGFSKAKTLLDKSISGVAAWRLHDLRRTCATGMARLGIALPTIEKALNHSSGSFAGIVGTYQRHTFAEETKFAFIAWGDHVARVASGAAANVVPFRQPEEVA